MVDHFTIEVGETWLKVDKILAKSLQEKINEVLTISTMIGMKTEFDYGIPGETRRTVVSFLIENKTLALHFQYDEDSYLDEIKVYQGANSRIDKDKPKGNNGLLKSIEIMKDALRSIRVDKEVV